MTFWSRTSIGGALSVATLLLSLATADAVAEVPRWIASDRAQESGIPLWVSVDEAAPNGVLRRELFQPNAYERFRQNLAANPRLRSEPGVDAPDTPCTEWIHPSTAHSESWSPEELLERAGVVYVARVEDVEPGFLRGNLGTMIEATVLEVPKEPPSGPVPGRILVFYRYAEVALEEGYLCTVEVRKATPKVGGTLILAPLAEEPTWSEESIFWVNDTELFFDTESGELSSPFAYGELQMEAAVLGSALRSASAQEGSR